MIIALAAPPLAAEHEPLWELGAGASLLQLPDYRGSDQSRNYLIPFPYLVYRGSRLRMDGSSASGRLLDRERFKLDISLGGSLPVNSADNEARRGMPDLDPAGELGPNLQIVLSHNEVKQEAWRLNLPLRAVLATDFSSIHYEGWLFNPHIDYIRRIPGDRYYWRLVVSFGPIYGDALYHDYLYSVDQAFAIPGERPAYDAPGGYSGSRLLVTLGHNLSRRLLVGGFLRYDDLRGTAFDDSPLLRDRGTFMAGLALTIILGESAQPAQHQDL